jgi:hypothetical protein
MCLREQPANLPKRDALRNEQAVDSLVHHDGHAAVERNVRHDHVGRHDDVHVAAERNAAGLDSSEQADDHNVRHGARSIGFRDSPRDRLDLYGQKVIAVAIIAHISTRRRREKLAEYLK